MRVLCTFDFVGEVKVVFSNANPVVRGLVYAFYGGGDHVIGLATCSLEELLEFTVESG